VKRGVDVTRANLDDTNRRIRKLHPQSRRKHTEGGFRRAVGNHERNGELRRKRSDIHNHAATALAHSGKHQADQFHRRFDQ
jgi:hypothetical protein